MIYYLIYNSAGTILRMGSSVDPEQQLSEGELLIASNEVIDADIDMDCIVDGRVERKSNAEQIRRDFLWSRLRIRRNTLLAASDWTQIPGASLDAPAWAKYRAILRDITDGLDDPANVVWPVPPDQVVVTDRAEILASAKTKAITQINEACGAARLQFLTNIPGQETIYRWKEEQAIKYLSLTAEPENLNDFWLMQNEIGITANTPYELAQIWVNMAAATEQLAGLMEKLRLGTIMAIGAATNAAGVSAAITTFFQYLHATIPG